MEEATKNASVGAGWWTGGSQALPGLRSGWVGHTSFALNEDRLAAEHSALFYILSSFSTQLIAYLPAHDRSLLKWLQLQCKLHAPTTPHVCVGMHAHPPPTRRASPRKGTLICKAIWGCSEGQSSPKSFKFTFVRAFNWTSFFSLKTRRLFNPFNPISQLTGILFGSISTTYLH